MGVVNHSGVATHSGLVTPRGREAPHAPSLRSACRRPRSLMSAVLSKKHKPNLVSEYLCPRHGTQPAADVALAPVGACTSAEPALHTHT